MLKIIDEVDLKELEKFGFEPRYLENQQFKIPRHIVCYVKKTKDYEFKDFLGNVLTKYDGGVEILCNSRRIYLITEHYVGTEGSFELDLIYDLIQAGLVEKVVE